MKRLEKCFQDEEEEGEIRDLGATADRFRHGQVLPADYDIATQSDDEMGDEGEEEGDWSRLESQSLTFALHLSVSVAFVFTTFHS